MNLVDNNDTDTKIGASHLNLIPLCSTICCHVIVLIYWRIIKKTQLRGNFSTENTNKTLSCLYLKKQEREKAKRKRSVLCEKWHILWFKRIYNADRTNSILHNVWHPFD